MAPATTRRCTSFRWGRTVVKNRASSSRLTSTRQDYIARTNYRWTLSASQLVLAPPAGVEPATWWVEATRSIQLSYRGSDHEVTTVVPSAGDVCQNDCS